MTVGGTKRSARDSINRSSQVFLELLSTWAKMFGCTRRNTLILLIKSKNPNRCHITSNHALITLKAENYMYYQSGRPADAGLPDFSLCSLRSHDFSSHPS
ncbi:hypothetical protein Y032_0086g1922 [Ancylostoma ceylanicum]|uniref:Uncharacterized protein n=1 Tax=Ancylostoma ceylanicum TaxID=53326 RepID=A0A016TPM1_9BILA|nr:hypothetical protein Y032_0086g1922 [Ancylostoma ceylanicum]